MAETAALFSVSELIKNFSNALSTSTVLKKKRQDGSPHCIIYHSCCLAVCAKNPHPQV